MKKFFVITLMLLFALPLFAKGVNCNSFYNIEFGSSEDAGISYMESKGWKISTDVLRHEKDRLIEFTKDGGTYAGYTVELIKLRFYENQLVWGSVIFAANAISYNELEDLIDTIVNKYADKEDAPGIHDIYNGYENTEEAWLGISWEELLTESNDYLEQFSDYYEEDDEEWYDSEDLYKEYLHEDY